MCEEKTAAPEIQAPWNERDEIQRLDFVAGVVAPTSLAGCVASAALIATGHLVDVASYILGGAGLFLLGFAVLAILSLNWSPLEALHNDKELKDVIATKRSRTKWALAGLVISVLIGFGATAVAEMAADSDSDAQKERDTHSKGSGSHQQQGASGALGLHDQFADQNGNQHHRNYKSYPVVVDLRSGVIHRSLNLEPASKRTRLLL